MQIKNLTLSNLHNCERAINRKLVSTGSAVRIALNPHGTLSMRYQQDNSSDEELFKYSGTGGSLYLAKNALSALGVFEPAAELGGILSMLWVKSSGRVEAFFNHFSADGSLHLSRGKLKELGISEAVVTEEIKMLLFYLYPAQSEVAMFMAVCIGADVMALIKSAATFVGERS